MTIKPPSITVSGMLCTYFGDDEILLGQVLSAILEQTRRLDELVIVVDGPIPFRNEEVLVEGIEKFGASNIPVKLERLRVNSGHGPARDLAIKCASGDYVAIFDADDIPVKERIELLSEVAEATGVDVVGGLIEEVNFATGARIGVREVKVEHDDIIQDMYARCPMNNMTTLISMSALRKVDGYRAVYSNEDYDLWIRMAKAGCRFKNVPKILVRVNASDAYYSRRGGMQYFLSERFIQKELLKMHQSYIRYLKQIVARFIVYVCFPNRVRFMFFSKVLRVNDV
jgi:glycosyltransferase involved in cell wall biosynthesis